MKFSGKIGFWEEDKETKPGVYKSEIFEKVYTGDVIKNIQKFQAIANQQNENLVLNNRISIISDLYMLNNWASIKYVVWKGVKWKAKSIDVSNYPRIIIELGGVYNGTSSS